MSDSQTPTAATDADGGPSRPRRLFVAGATGATGRILVPLAARDGVPFVAHVRPRSDAGNTVASAAVVDLGDRDALVAAMRGCTTVLQLIGTTRRRFASGDTYESSDVGTTQQLVEAARAAGVDHVVLLSSVGAGRPVGAYLEAKAAAEALVRESGLAWTIFRPSAFIGGGHKPPPGFRAVTALFGLQRYRPIVIEDLAASLLFVARRRAPRGEVLEGGSLWRVVAEARAAATTGGA